MYSQSIYLLDFLSFLSFSSFLFLLIADIHCIIQCLDASFCPPNASLATGGAINSKSTPHRINYSIKTSIY